VGRGLFDEALDTFFIGQAPPGGLEEGERWEQLFTPWFVFDFVPAPRKRRRRGAGPAWPAATLALEFAQRHGDGLSPVEARSRRLTTTWSSTSVNDSCGRAGPSTGRT